MSIRAVSPSVTLTTSARTSRVPFGGSSRFSLPSSSLPAKRSRTIPTTRRTIEPRLGRERPKRIAPRSTPARTDHAPCKRTPAEAGALRSSGGVRPALVGMRVLAIVRSGAPPSRTIYPAVIGLARLIARDGGQQGADQDRDEGDDTPGGEVTLFHRDSRQVERGEQVVFLACNGADDREHDHRNDAPDPHGDALASAVEPGHPARDIPAREVGDERDYEQRNAARQADRLGLRACVADGVELAKRDRGAGRRHESSQEGADANGNEPAEECRPPVRASVLVVLALPHRGGVRPCRWGPVLGPVVVSVGVASPPDSVENRHASPPGLIPCTRRIPRKRPQTPLWTDVACATGCARRWRAGSP